MSSPIERAPDSHQEIAEAFPEILAEHAVIPAEQDSRLYGDLREETRTLTLLQDVSQELTAILNREALLAAIAGRVRQIVDYQLLTVMLWNEERELLEADFSLRFDQRIQLRTALPLGVGLCGTAAAERRAVRVGRVKSDSRYVRCDCDSGVEVRSELVVPLIIKGKLIGVLDLESTREDAFAACDEKLLVTLAPTIAIAIENARLYEQVRQGKQRLAEELARARDVQQMLLPPATPRIAGVDVSAGYRPARELGGDFYDFLRYPNGDWVFAVGDVAGKGTAAALYASLGVGMLREHAIAHPCPPQEMLEHLNERLHHSFGGLQSDGRFIALLLGVYDAGKRRLQIANAGFPYPHLWRNGAAQPLQVGGVPLGLLPGTTYESLEVQLEPGNVVAFCSDGLHEAGAEAGKEFGLSRLCREFQRLAPAETAQQIVEGLLAATEGHRVAGDDRTVVVLRARN